MIYELDYLFTKHTFTNWLRRLWRRKERDARYQ